MSVARPGLSPTFPCLQVDFVSTPIKRFTETGVELEDGQQHDLDVVFCATGEQIIVFESISYGGP